MSLNNKPSFRRPDVLLEKWVAWINNARTRWRWIGYVLSAAAFLYLVVLLFYSGVQVSNLEMDWQLYGIASLASLLFYLLSLLVQFAVWARLLSFHHRVSWQDVAIYSRTILLRRLPGGVWHWVGRVAMYSGSTQVPARVVLLGNFLEWVMLLLIAGAIALIGIEPNVLLVSLAVLLVLLAGWLAYTWQPRERPALARLGESAGWICLYSLAWVFGGLIVAVLVRAAGSLDLTVGRSVWIWAVTGGSSLLLVIVPAGLGVREFTLTLALQPYLSPPSAIIVAVLIRVIFTIADLLWGFLGFVISTNLVRKTGHTQEGPSLTE